jgi:bifunctional DNA-binding transcriptional regulator/antitoxin component of YhaV-PrlF toxin-antitoxin module
MEVMKLSEKSKVYINSRAFLTAIPVLIRKNLNIEKGDYLEWNLDNKTDELCIKIIKPND